jgi:hypothetical protein
MEHTLSDACFSIIVRVVRSLIQEGIFTKEEALSLFEGLDAQEGSEHVRERIATARDMIAHSRDVYRK